MTGGYPLQTASNAEKLPISWHHHVQPVQQCWAFSLQYWWSLTFPQGQWSPLQGSPSLGHHTDCQCQWPLHHHWRVLCSQYTPHYKHNMVALTHLSLDKMTPVIMYSLFINAEPSVSNTDEVWHFHRVSGHHYKAVLHSDITRLSVPMTTPPPLEVLCIQYTPHYKHNMVALTHLSLDKILADDIFRCIFMNEKFCIAIKISLKCVPRGPVDNNPALV